MKAQFGIHSLCTLGHRRTYFATFEYVPMQIQREMPFNLRDKASPNGAGALFEGCFLVKY